jgi:hypothetical protein
VKKPPFCHKIFTARETPISKKTEKRAKKRQNTGKTVIYKKPKVSQSHFLAKIVNFFTFAKSTTFFDKICLTNRKVKSTKTKRQSHTQRSHFLIANGSFMLT